MNLKFFGSSLLISLVTRVVFVCVLAAIPSLRSAPVVDTVTKLVPSDISPNLFFGTSVVIDNGLAAVGAPDVNSGAVYTYALVGGSWVQTQKLTQPAPACGTNGFGVALALQDGVLAVAEPTGCVEVGPGQVFIYKLVGGTWVLEQQIQPVPAFPFSGFGTALALSGNTLAVGNPADGTGPGSGTVSIYTNDASGFFFFQAKVAAPSNTFQAFTGTSVALDGNTLVAGAPGFTVAGAAFQFQRFGTNWFFQSTIRDAFSTGADFGRSAAAHGGILVIGAPGESDANGILGGAAYIQTPFQKLTAPNNVRGLGFGTSVSVFNGTVVVGIPFRTVNGKTNAGAADIFVNTGTNFVLAQEITASDPSSGAEFGNAVNIGASGVIVGAPFDSTIVTNGGAAYIFSPSETNQPVIVSASASPNILFPPNHKLVPVTISITTQGNAATCKITRVTSNQPINGKGDGNTSPDWIITGDLTVLLRAERAGNIKTDRIYSITVECTDAFGNSASTTVQVTVPHDRGK